MGGTWGLRGMGQRDLGLRGQETDLSHSPWIPFHESNPLGFSIRGHGGDMGTWGHGTTGLGTEGARNWFWVTRAPWPQKLNTLPWNQPLEPCPASLAHSQRFLSVYLSIFLSIYLYTDSMFTYTHVCLRSIHAQILTMRGHASKDNTYKCQQETHYHKHSKIHLK